MNQAGLYIEELHPTAKIAKILPSTLPLVKLHPLSVPLDLPPRRFVTHNNLLTVEILSRTSWF
jgi:hypothetical protein